MKIWLNIALLFFLPQLHAQTLSGPQDIYRYWRNDRNLPWTEMPAASGPSELPASVHGLPGPLQEMAQGVMKARGTIALLLMERGAVVYEAYDKGSSADDRMLGFSMSKSMTALAVGTALCEGKIASLDDRAERYADELKGTAYGEASVRDLLRMASGAKGGTSQLHGQPRQGATSDLVAGRVDGNTLFKQFGSRDTLLFSPVQPGSRFSYSNVDTDALARVVQGAVGEPFASWFHRTVLSQSRPEKSSWWAMDRAGGVIAHATYMASLRDWARLANWTLDLHQRRIGSKCLQDYVQDAAKKQIATQNRVGFQGYGYQMWRDDRTLPASSFWMLGFGGQRIGMDPASEKIVVTFAWQPEEQTFDLFRRWIQP